MPTLTLQIVSDLHLETPLVRPTYDQFNIIPRCSHLALLGDIGHVSDDRLFNFIRIQLSRFEIVFFLLGNHEPFGTSFPEAQSIVSAFADTVERMRLTSLGLGQFVFLNKTRFDVSKDLTILGCTLFSKVRPSQKETVRLFVSDFSSIENWTVEDHCDHHHADLAWLNRQVAHIAENEPSRSIIIFSHHSPTISKAANDPKHWDDSNEVNSAFVTDLSQQTCWISPNVKLWAFGHTHYNCDYMDSQTGKRVLANQKGYKRSEAEGFDVDKIISLDYDIEDLRSMNHQQASRSTRWVDHVFREPPLFCSRTNT